MDGEWYEDTFAGFQPPQPEFSLPTTIACSDTIHPSPNSLFLLKQHNFRISLTISYFNNATFLLLVPSPVLPNITDPTPRHSLLISLQPLRECPQAEHPTPSPPPATPVAHLHLSPCPPGDLCLDTLSTDLTHPSSPSQILTLLNPAQHIQSWHCPPYL